MFKSNPNLPKVENITRNQHHHLLCWKSVFGGLVISLMGFVILSALGAGLAGLGVESMINQEKGGSSLGTMGGLWLGLSVLASLFCGGYFTMRIARFTTHRIGAAHGFVVGSLFFGLLLMGAGGVLGGLAHGLGQAVAGASQGAASVASNPMVQDTFDKAFGNTTLKSDPKVVAQNLAIRLLHGDTESAKNYFAYQTGLSREEADAKFAQLQNEFTAAAKEAGEAAAHAVADTGWMLFVVFLVGLLGAVMGGRLGADANFERPFANLDR